MSVDTSARGVPRGIAGTLLAEHPTFVVDVFADASVASREADHRPSRTA